MTPWEEVPTITEIIAIARALPGDPADQAERAVPSDWQTLALMAAKDLDLLFQPVDFDGCEDAGDALRKGIVQLVQTELEENPDAD